MIKQAATLLSFSHETGNAHIKVQNVYETFYIPLNLFKCSLSQGLPIWLELAITKDGNWTVMSVDQRDFQKTAEQIKEDAEFDQLLNTF